MCNTITSIYMYSLFGKCLDKIFSQIYTLLVVLCRPFLEFYLQCWKLDFRNLNQNNGALTLSHPLLYSTAGHRKASTDALIGWLKHCCHVNSKQGSYHFEIFFLNVICLMTFFFCLLPKSNYNKQGYRHSVVFFNLVLTACWAPLTVV